MYTSQTITYQDTVSFESSVTGMSNLSIHLHLALSCIPFVPSLLSP